MKRMFAVTLALTSVGIIVAYSLGLYPLIVLHRPDILSSRTTILSENQPFQHFDFEQGDYTAYAVIGINDLLGSWSDVPRSRLIKSSDKLVLNQLKACEFSNKGDDSINIDSRFYLLRNDSIIYQCGLVLDHEYEGLHNKGTGWAESKQKGQLLRILHQFEKEWKPIVIVN